MRFTHLVPAAVAAVVALGLVAVPAAADPPPLPQPTVHFVNFPTLNSPRRGEVVAEIPLATAATAIVYTYADDAPAPELTPETVGGMSPLALTGVDADRMAAQSSTLSWSGYVTRNFAVYSTDGNGNYSAPTYFSVAGMTDSPTDPGPNPGFTYWWSWATLRPTMTISMDRVPRYANYGFLAQGTTVAPDPATAFAHDETYRYVSIVWDGGTFTPRDPEGEWLDLSTGAPVTLTVFHYNVDFTHYTRTAYSMKVGSPTKDIVTVSGLSERSWLGSTTFTVQMNGTTTGSYGTADYRFEFRAHGKPWKTFGTVSSTRSTPGSVTIPAHTQGYQVRAILLTAGANLASPPHTLVLKRKLSLTLYHKAPAGSTRTMKGVATGRKAGQTVEIQRCATSKAGCSHYRTVTLTKDEHFSLTVGVPKTPGVAWFYRAVEDAHDPWTPAVTSAMVHVVAL